MNDIKDFRIGKAFYLLENDKGSKLRLSLNYAEFSYSYKVISDRGRVDRLKKQAVIIAKDMLGKKAQKNLNYKLLQLNMKV